MRWTPPTSLCAVFLLAFLAVTPQQTKAQATDKGQPEMVWLNYTDGEVKFSPGHNGRPQLGKDWIQANPGQVMETGYTLVTEQGRAELEFENGTMLYLAPNSALEFDTLWSAPGTFWTEVDLLTGTATVAHRSGDEVDLDTPVTRLRFVGSQTARVESALDGIVIKTLAGVQSIETRAGETVLKDGESAAFVNGELIPLTVPARTSGNVTANATVLPTGLHEDVDVARWASNSVRQQIEERPEADEWDRWVAGRLANREALIAEGLKESGLTEPIPGLAAMVANGTFVDCSPYGKCWQPNEAPSMPVPATAQVSPALPPTQHPTPQTPPTTILVNQTMLTRCPMETWRMRARSQATSAATVPQYGTCFAGSWNPSWNPCVDRYTTTDPAIAYAYWPQCYATWTWVVGRRHRHSCHFRRGHNHHLGFVPRHPTDRPGHRLVNAKSGVLTLNFEKGHLQAGAEPPSPKGLQLGANVPRGVDRALMQNAPRVAQPVIEARMAEAIMPDALVLAHSGAARDVTAIHFDFRSQNFIGKSGSVTGASHSVVVGHASGGGGVSGGSHASSGAGGPSGGGGHSGGGSSTASSAGAAAGGGGHH